MSHGSDSAAGALNIIQYRRVPADRAKSMMRLTVHEPLNFPSSEVSAGCLPRDDELRNEHLKLSDLPGTH